MSELISRQAAISEIVGMTTMGVEELVTAGDKEKFDWIKGLSDSLVKIINLPSAQPEQRPLTEADYAYCAECDPEVKCLSCGHHIAERPFEVYCNIMCKWVNEKDYCTMFEPGQEKMRKTET